MKPIDELAMRNKVMEARQISVKESKMMFVYSNGREIIYYDTQDNTAKDRGYWICAIFDHGNDIDI